MPTKEWRGDAAEGESPCETWAANTINWPRIALLRHCFRKAGNCIEVICPDSIGSAVRSPSGACSGLAGDAV